MVSNIPFGSYQLERKDYLKTYSFSVGISEKWPYHYPPSGISEIFFQMVSTPGCDRDIFCNIFVIMFYVYKTTWPARRDLDPSKQELGKLLHKRMHDDDLSQPLIYTYNVTLFVGDCYVVASL